MSAIKRIVGLDAVDIVVQLGLTFFLMMLFDEKAPNGQGIAIVGVLSTVVFGIRRHFGLKQLPPATTGEIAAERMAELEARVNEMDQMHFRIQELEERLDFAERLLAQGRADAVRIGEGQ
jgi:hypothetical protein